MSWGAKLIGFDAVMDTFDALEMKFEGDAVYVVGPTVEYSVFVEGGTSRMKAQPFLFPAARSVQRELPSIIAGQDSMEAIVKTAALEIERRAKQRCPVDTGTLRASITTQKV